MKKRLAPLNKSRTRRLEHVLGSNWTTYVVIGSTLQDCYNDAVIRQPIPKRLKNLLQELDEELARN
jgi:hypothetical protein